MARMCLGSQLPGGHGGQGLSAAQRPGRRQSRAIRYGTSRTVEHAGAEARRLLGIRSTHKQWWECSTGIAYMPGSKNARLHPAAPQWRQSQAMLIYDWQTSERSAGLHPHVRLAGRPARRDGAGAELAARSDLRATSTRKRHSDWRAGRHRATTSSATASTRRGASATTA